MAEPTPIEDRLRSTLAALADDAPAHAPGREERIDAAIGDHRRRFRQRRHLLAGAAATATVAAGGGLAYALTRSPDGRTRPEVRTTGPDPTAPSAPRPTPSKVPSGWRAIAPAPLSERVGAAVVAIDSGFLVWGGDRTSGRRDQQDHLTDGAYWEAETNSWTKLAPTGFDLGLTPANPIAVWTGTEAIFGLCEPATLDRRNRSDYSPSLIAYDPAAQRWRGLGGVPGELGTDRPDPFGFTGPVTVATTDGRVFGIGRQGRGHPAGDGAGGRAHRSGPAQAVQAGAARAVPVRALRHQPRRRRRPDGGARHGAGGQRRPRTGLAALDRRDLGCRSLVRPDRARPVRRPGTCGPLVDRSRGRGADEPRHARPGRPGR